MRVMGCHAIYPNPNLSRPARDHLIYPYLLKGLEILGPVHVWCTDITYIRIRRGFVYLMALMDWFSRHVLVWEISISLDEVFCLTYLERAFNSGLPVIFNIDQGAQFTSQAFTGKLQEGGIRISMDDRGRAYDNIFIERL
jgi:putative transposase